MLFWALMASKQITMRRVDGWQTLDQAPVEQRLERAELLSKYRYQELRRKPISTNFRTRPVPKRKIFGESIYAAHSREQA